MTVSDQQEFNTLVLDVIMGANPQKAVIKYLNKTGSPISQKNQIFVLSKVLEEISQKISKKKV